MDHHPLKEDCEKAWSNCKDESSNPAINRQLHCPPYFWNSPCVSANSNPAFYNISHCGTPEFPNYERYLAEPCHEDANPYYPWYKHSEAMGHKNFHPLYRAQPCNSAMDHKKYSHINFSQQAMPSQSHAMAPNRKSRPYNKRKQKQVNAEKIKGDIFQVRSPVVNDIGTKNNNQQKNFDRAEGVYNCVPESQLLSNGNGVVRNDNKLLNECSFNETNLKYDLALQGIQTKSSTHFNFAESSSSFLTETNESNLDGGANIYDPDQNKKFANDKFHILNDPLNKSIEDMDTIQLFDSAQVPTDASLSQPALNTTTLAIRSSAESDTENTFTLQTLYEGQDENGKDVIVLLAAPEVQQQIAQANDPVDTIGEEQSTKAEKTAFTAKDLGGNENNFISDGDSLTYEVQNDGDNIFTSKVNEDFEIEETVRTSNGRSNYNKKKERKRKRSANSQTQIKQIKVIDEENEAGPSQVNNKIEFCQPRLKTKLFNGKKWRERLKWRTYRASYKGLQDIYFYQFAQKYFKEKCIRNKELQDIMMMMLTRIGGNVLKSIHCSFEVLERFYKAKTE